MAITRKRKSLIGLPKTSFHRRTKRDMRISGLRVYPWAPVDPLGPLGDGYRVEARIVIWSSEHVTKVPGSSVFRVGDDWHVFVVKSGRAREHEVKVGQRNRDEVEVLAGLSPGATVVRYPGNEIKDGVRVIGEAR
jgi:multidrug efflux pump subunit AcrA (membrane-fusion protein)